MTANKDFKLMCAPIQGFTEVAFRHFHAALYGPTENPGSPVTYFSPFIRLEKGSVRPRDMRDIRSPLNSNHHTVPQIIFKDADEFSILTEEMVNAGYREIDLNLGCPFVPQMRKGRGAAMIGKPDTLTEVCRLIRTMPEISFSIKMRAGVSAPEEWHELIPAINSTPFDHITVHPRTAAQQYSGVIHYDQFNEMIHAFDHPVIFNGDIESVTDIAGLRERFPELKGIMIGRGLLKRPSLIAEWFDEREWSHSERMNCLLKLHSAILDHYRETLTGGDAQILMKIKPYWEYFGSDADRKSVKKIMKASSLQKYEEAVRNIG